MEKSLNMRVGVEDYPHLSSVIILLGINSHGLQLVPSEHSITKLSTLMTTNKLKSNHKPFNTVKQISSLMLLSQWKDILTETV